jgi:transmembrane sensor
MKEFAETEVRTDLEREALARVRHLVSGDATLDDVEEAKRWKQISPDHAKAFAFASRLWDRLGPAGRNVLERRGETLPSGRSFAAPHFLSRRAVIGGTAALTASAVYVIARPPYDLWPSFSELTADYRTATGEQKRVDLADGASVELNTQTSIAFRSTNEKGAHIELINGEAMISTGPKLLEVLTVIAGDGRISSRNSRFNVRYDGQASCDVTCLDGMARVERLGVVQTLESGRHVAYTHRGLGASETIDADIATAWRNGLLVFRQTPLAEVVAEINRYRPGRIVLMNADLGHRPVNARFRIDNVDEIMTLAQRVFGAKIRSLPGGIVLLS